LSNVELFVTAWRLSRLLRSAGVTSIMCGWGASPRIFSEIALAAVIWAAVIIAVWPWLPEIAPVTSLVSLPFPVV
jgi:hypothetical protein